MIESPAQTKGEDASMANATTVAKKDKRVPNAGKRMRMLTKDRRSIEQERGGRNG